MHLNLEKIRRGGHLICKGKVSVEPSDPSGWYLYLVNLCTMKQLLVFLYGYHWIGG